MLYCGKCGNVMKNFGGMGRDPVWICSNTECPTKFPQKCPNCDGSDKTIEIIGLGNVRFTCNQCGHSWFK